MGGTSAEQVVMGGIRKQAEQASVQHPSMVPPLTSLTDGLQLGHVSQINQDAFWGMVFITVTEGTLKLSLSVQVEQRSENASKSKGLGGSWVIGSNYRHGTKMGKESVDKCHREGRICH